MTSAETEQNFFLNLETKLHQKEIRNSKEELSALLDEDFIEFGSSGRMYNKADTLMALGEEAVDLDITVEDFVAKHLSEDVVLVTYKTSKINPKDNSRFKSLRSSIWKLSSGKWRMIFHQGTMVAS